MIEYHRYTIKVAGESGQGINSIGEMIAKAIKRSGWHTFGYREYPSLIKGGFSSHQIDVSDQPIVSPSHRCNILLCLSRFSFHEYLPTVREGGIIIHSIPKMDISEAEQQLIAQKNLQVEFVPAGTLALQIGGTWVMANTVLLGVLWQLIGLPLEVLSAIITAEFAKKPEVIAKNIECLHLGSTLELNHLNRPMLSFTKKPELVDDMLLTGNHAFALGAMAAGVRAYYAYPMTPSSSILSFMTAAYKETGMLVKQVEDEISVAQMALGSMFAGTRALVATSGGGFDLMTETVSLAAMTEVPFVCILAQRPGPATGLPTWTAAGDLNLAIYSGHGEFTRCVIAASDPASCYTLIQKAFNLAEKYQIPVIVLTEKEIAESLFQVADLPADEPIERHLVPADALTNLKPTDRYKITDNGISLRWLPGQTDATFNGNSDEHTEDGSLTEAAEASAAMYTKRLKKAEALQAELPPPVIYGPPNAALGLVGWGSVKNSILDALNLWNTAHPDKQIAYLHYEYIYPLKVQPFWDFTHQVGRVVLVENNAFGQLGKLITQESGYLFSHRLLKYDGRPFFVEEIMEFLTKELS